MNDEYINGRVLCDIARCSFEAINRLLSRDQLLALQMRSRRTGSRQIYREECITVEMTAALLEQFPNQVEIAMFTPAEETRVGADWYWRFERGGRAIHARVQAKRVQRDEFGQPDHQGRVDIDMPQLTQLLKATNEASSQLPGLEAWLATYARFDATPPCGNDDLTNCSHHRHQGACASHIPSLWIAQAKEIAGLRLQRPSVKEVIQHSLRLDCLLPCVDQPRADYGPENKGFALRSGLKSYQDCVAIIQGDSLLRQGFEGALRITV